MAAVEEPAENVGGGEDGEVVNTKLYFGNLPYSVDSAQLAGIIQDYGSPELVEVEHCSIILIPCSLRVSSHFDL